MRARLIPISLLMFALPLPAHAADGVLLPPAVREMMEAAIANGNETDIATVAKIAKQTNPASADEIQRMVNSWKERTKATHDTVIREARFTELWTGRIEAGGFRSTGSTSEIGISAAATATRNGIQWTHKLTASADYRRANGVTSRERYFGSYEPRYEFDARGFAYGLGQFERDTSIGYDERYTGSIGVGYKLIVSKPLDLSADIGPSIRHAKYVIGDRETKLGVRGSMAMTWRVTPTLTVKQTAAGYAESEVYTLNSLTSVETKVSTRWSAALSYNVQYESETLLSARDFDTLSRLTLTYDF
ncbi:YdiY family protein [Sphingobium rhizovicinum]|uniref:YdiY family protein n=1 Tax=Sphingobium rhizovicinum TaxID=432308 RepID=A0ABV7NDS4_9SPHN